MLLRSLCSVFIVTSIERNPNEALLQNQFRASSNGKQPTVNHLEDSYKISYFMRCFLGKETRTTCIFNLSTDIESRTHKSLAFSLRLWEIFDTVICISQQELILLLFIPKQRRISPS